MQHNKAAGCEYFSMTACKDTISDVGVCCDTDEQSLTWSRGDVKQFGDYSGCEEWWYVAFLFLSNSETSVIWFHIFAQKCDLVLFQYI